MQTKPCYGQCERCVWFRNGGCSEWNGTNKPGETVKLEEIINADSNQK